MDALRGKARASRDLRKALSRCASTVGLVGSSNAGFAVGRATNNLIGQLGAFWNNDAAHTLTVLPTLGGTSIAQAVNNFGDAAGYSVGPAGFHAVVWGGDPAHTPVDLGALPGDDGSQANAINDAGQVVGISSNSIAGTQTAFLCAAGEMVPLASLLDASGTGWTIDQPAAINNVGQIAGSALFNGIRPAFVMTPIQ